MAVIAELFERDGNNLISVSPASSSAEADEAYEPYSSPYVRDAAVYDEDGVPSVITDPTPQDWDSATHLQAGTKAQLIQRIAEAAGNTPCVIELTNDITYEAAGVVEVSSAKIIKITSSTSERRVISGANLSSVLKNAGGILYLENLEIKDGKASLGGGIDTSNYGGELVLNNVIIHDCTTTGVGAAIRCFACSAYIYDSEIYDCTAAGGSAVHNQTSTILIRRSKLYNNKFTGTSNQLGGGAIGMQATGPGGPIEVYDSEFYSNHSGSHGGAIALADFVVLKDCDFHENDCQTNGGALLFLWQTSSVQKVTIYGCTFTENVAGDESSSSSRGGAIAFAEEDKSGSYNHIINCTFTDNISWGTAGALYLNKQDTIIRNLVFDGNRAVEGNGGAIYSANPDIEIDNCKFMKNSAARYGGAYISSPTSINRFTGECVFYCNRAGIDGGAIDIEPGNYGSIRIGPDVVFSGNHAGTAHLVSTANVQDFADYQAYVQATQFTSPFPYAYNNYDISYPNGVVDEAVCVPLRNLLPCASGCVQTDEAGYLADVPLPPDALCSPPNTEFCGWFADEELTIPVTTCIGFTASDSIYACWSCLDDDYVFDYVEMECKLETDDDEDEDDDDDTDDGDDDDSIGSGSNCETAFGDDKTAASLFGLVGALGDMQSEYGNILSLITSELSSAFICNDKQSQDRILSDVLEILNKIESTSNVSDEAYASVFGLLDKLKQC